MLEAFGKHRPAGYRFDVAPNDVASFVLGKCTWAALALTCHMELFTLTHYRASIGADEDVSGLYKDVFLFHWKEESQHAILDELEWARADGKLSSDAERDAAIDDLMRSSAASTQAWRHDEGYRVPGEFVIVAAVAPSVWLRETSKPQPQVPSCSE